MASPHTNSSRGSAIRPRSASESELVSQVAANSPDALAALYRLHGGALFRLARRLSVSVVRSPERMELTVTDDGTGFDLEAVRRHGSGLGLVSIEERAHVLGGEAEITSRPRQGTTVRVRGPAGSAAAAT